MRLLLHLLSLMTLSMSFLPMSAIAEYFFDQGLQTAVVRTDYDEIDEGTAANPITMAPGNILYPCSDPLLIFSCKESGLLVPCKAF